MGAALQMHINGCVSQRDKGSRRSEIKYLATVIYDDRVGSNADCQSGSVTVVFYSHSIHHRPA